MASKVEPDKTLEDEVALLDLEKSDDLAKLKIIKRQRKAAVTRTIGAIGVCVADRDPSEVKSKLSTLTDQFVNFTYVRGCSNFWSSWGPTHKKGRSEGDQISFGPQPCDGTDNEWCQLFVLNQQCPKVRLHRNQIIDC